MKMIVKVIRIHMALQRMTPLLRFYHHQDAIQWLYVSEKKKSSTLAKIESIKSRTISFFAKYKQNTKKLKNLKNKRKILLKIKKQFRQTRLC